MYKDGSIALQGITIDMSVKPHQLSLQMLHAWEEHNEIGAMATGEQISHETAETAIPPEIQVTLSEFADVFYEPKNLPPTRQYDHAITLEE